MYPTCIFRCRLPAGSPTVFANRRRGRRLAPTMPAGSAALAALQNRGRPGDHV